MRREDAIRESSDAAAHRGVLETTLPA
jgi:hypothetical protein